jgi:hypothetical protein
MFTPSVIAAVARHLLSFLTWLLTGFVPHAIPIPGLRLLLHGTCGRLILQLLAGVHLGALPLLCIGRTC